MSQQSSQQEEQIAVTVEPQPLRDILGEFTLHEILGSGVTSEVMLGSKSSDGSQYAIKVLGRTGLDKTMFLERFEKEVRACKALRHKNIVRYISSKSEATRIKSDGS